MHGVGTGSSGAGRGGRRYAAAPMAELNIIPLVDVVLVVLILFMVSTSFEKPKEELPPAEPALQLPLQLPFSSAAIEQPEDERPLLLGIDKEGRKYVGAEPVTTEVLQRRLREEAAKNPERRVRIEADQDARYIDVIEVVELCGFEGLRDVGFGTATKNQ